MRVTVLDALSSGPGLAILLAALLMTVALEVLDQRAAPTNAAGGEAAPRGTRRRMRARVMLAMRVALVVLLLAALAATGIRLFVVVR